MKLGTYTWRGKTYKTLAGLHDRALRHYPGCSITFDAGNFIVIGRDAEKEVYLFFSRSIDEQGNSVIEDQARDKLVKPR